MKSNWLRLDYKKHTPWIHTATFDLSFILAPAFLICGIVLLWPDFAQETSQVPLWVWVVFVMGIDVSHVYSTLYRTYFDNEEFNQRRVLYTITPLVCWVVGILLYSFGSNVFWSALAYAAVFHFIRQQYGFMMLYLKRGTPVPEWCAKIDMLAIYSATLYPMIYWHTTPRNFVWMIEGDFLTFNSPTTAIVGRYAYILILATYFLKEIYLYTSDKNLNIPKNLLLIGTILSWYIGIVLYNGDMAFTMTNVVSHGIPYIALIWIYGRKKWSKKSTSNNSSFISKAFSYSFIPIFLISLLAFSYFEEALWDLLVWGERGKLFGGMFFGAPIQSNSTLNWIVPLLAVPQATHYILDGFIWRFKNSSGTLKEISTGTNHADTISG